nr:hypothetical protein Iba_chr07cCG10560 [Ipomoea batatas]GMD18039.1 hypothetical protein Iba_chr07dCG9430 [Ipomoea batatas]
MYLTCFSTISPSILKASASQIAKTYVLSKVQSATQEKLRKSEMLTKSLNLTISLQGDSSADSLPNNSELQKELLLKLHFSNFAYGDSSVEWRHFRASIIKVHIKFQFQSEI